MRVANQVGKSSVFSLSFSASIVVCADKGRSSAANRLLNYAAFTNWSPNRREEMPPQVLLTATGFAARETLAMFRKHNIATAPLLLRVRLSEHVAQVDPGQQPDALTARLFDYCCAVPKAAAAAARLLPKSSLLCLSLASTASRDPGSRAAISSSLTHPLNASGRASKQIISFFIVVFPFHCGSNRQLRLRFLREPEQLF